MKDTATINEILFITVDACLPFGSLREYGFFLLMLQMLHFYLYKLIQIIKVCWVLIHANLEHLLILNIYFEMDNNNNIDAAKDAINLLVNRLEEDAVKQNLKRKSEVVPNTCAKEQSESETCKKTCVNLFANSGRRQQKPLFGADQKQSVNLFKMDTPNKQMFSQKVQGAKNIFNLASKPAIATEEDSPENQKSDGNGGQSQTYSSNSFKTDPDVKVMNYEYSHKFDKVGEFQLKKFKAGTQSPKQEVYVTIQRPEKNSIYTYIFIRNSATKIVVFSGFVTQSLLKIENMMGKPDILKFNVIKKKLAQPLQGNDQKTEEAKGSISKQLVKLQFFTQDKAQEFKQLIGCTKMENVESKEKLNQQQ